MGLIMVVVEPILPPYVPSFLGLVMVGLYPVVSSYDVDFVQ